MTSLGLDMTVSFHERISPAVIGPDGLTIRQAGVEKPGLVGTDRDLSPRASGEDLTALGDDVFTDRDRLVNELRSLGFKVPKRPLVERMGVSELLLSPRTYVMISAALIVANR